MNNYNRYYERENPQSYHQYNLWQNSHFNNGFNLQYEFYDASFHCSSNGSTPNSQKSEEIADPENSADLKNRRVIGRESLFLDPDLFYSQENGEKHHEHQNGYLMYPAGYDWTQKNWLKAGSTAHPMSGPAQGPSGAHNSPCRANKLMKRLADATAAPPLSDKAESMMQKMGWQGGALGKSGDGIVEPITPNAAYALSTRGFGLATAPAPSAKPKPAPKHRPQKNREHFNTNVLLNILEFVKNESEAEVVFDRKLNSRERKVVHSLVNSLGDGEEMRDVDNMAQMDIINKIHKCSSYVLSTQSEGEGGQRRLCLYKEAPENVYLITPEDLKDNPPEEITEEKQNCSTDDKSMESDEKNMEIQDEETNPFLRSITRNLKSEPEEKIEENMSKKIEECNLGQLDVTGKILKYFLEFLQLNVYTEFRFLGPFEAGELDRINEFLSNVSEFLRNGVCSKEYEKVVVEMRSEEFGFYVKEDCNESVVICKYKKDAQRS